MVTLSLECVYSMQGAPCMQMRQLHPADAAEVRLKAAGERTRAGPRGAQNTQLQFLPFLRLALGPADPSSPEPSSAYLVEVAQPPGRRRHSRCSSSACVAGTGSRPGSVWPGRHLGAASVGVVGSGLRGAAGGLLAYPLQPVGHSGRASAWAPSPSFLPGRSLLPGWVGEWSSSGVDWLFLCESPKRWLQEGSRRGGKNGGRRVGGGMGGGTEGGTGGGMGRGRSCRRKVFLGCVVEQQSTY